MRKLNADIIYDLIVYNIISTLIELRDQLYSVGCKFQMEYFYWSLFYVRNI